MNISVPKNPGERLSSKAVTGQQHKPESASSILWYVPEEVPCAIMYNSQPFAVMMATPADLADFAIGFSLSERIVSGKDAIKGVICLEVEKGWCVDIAVAEGIRRQPRSIEGRSGCGLCGVEEIGQVMRDQPVVSRHFALEAQSVATAFRQLPAHQPMNALNKSVHAAAWCRPSGDIVLAREDVGRHNALDKLIGGIAALDLSFADGFVFMSSRCSFELVQKVAAVGISYIATISAPTSLALDIARKANIGIATYAREGAVIFDPGTPA